MSTLLIILSFLTALFIIGTIWTIIDYDTPETVSIISIMGLLGILAFGWGIGASLSTYYTKEQPVECLVEKTSRDVIVYSKEDKAVTFDSKYDYDNINDSTKFYYLIEYNHYGFEITRTLKY